MKPIVESVNRVLEHYLAIDDSFRNHAAAEGSDIESATYRSK